VEYRKSGDRKRHVEYVLKDGRKTRIEFPEGSPNYGQIILEVGNTRFHYIPGREEVQKTPARGDDAVARLASMIRNTKRFNIVTAGADTIAGIKAQRANFTDSLGNTVQSLWIDTKSGLILKRELYDQVGLVVGAFEFQTVNLHPKIRREDFTINRKGIKVVQLDERLHRLCDVNGFLPNGIKENRGYQWIAVRVLNPKGRQPILMQTYKADKKILSLFQVKGALDQKRLERLATARFRSYSWTVSNHTFALIGDMSEVDLKHIADLVGQR
jgi:outer membrane lipoprotein-sorting protein